MSYTTTFYHIIIRTRYSEPSIVVEHERELYAYMLGIARNLGCTVYRNFWRRMPWLWMNGSL